VARASRQLAGDSKGDANGGARNAAKATGDGKRLLKRILHAAEDVTLQRSSVDFAPYNPRQMKPAAFKKLCDSVRKNGLVQKPLVNKRSVEKGFPEGSRMTFVAGHQRIRAVDKIGGTTEYEFGAQVIDVDLPTEKALNVALNNPTLQAQFDMELLQGVLESIADDGGDPQEAGFAAAEFEMMFDSAKLAGLFKEQEEAESDYVNQLQAMKEAGKSPAARAGTEGGEQRDVGSDDVGSNGDAAPTTPPPDNQPFNADQAVKDDLRAKRERYKASRANDDAGDVMLTVVFDDPEQLRDFMQRFRLDDVRYFDAEQFAASLGVDWPAAGGGAGDLFG
jgi:hypothetical protein